MQSESFYLKFVTGLQCGVSSKLLEYETDWYEVMEILLSRLQDEPERKEQFELISSRDLEYWARIQPGGDTLNLKIRVSLEEKRYFLPPSGSRKTLRLVFNDRFQTQVLFHARKKMLLKSLRDLAAIAVSDHINKEEDVDKLVTEIPRSLFADVKRAFNNCWTPRFFRTKIVACPPWCACKTWRKPLASLEPKVKKTTRRQLYKGVAGKAVSKKSQKKQTSVKLVETKSKLKAKVKKEVPKESKKCTKCKKPCAKVDKKKSVHACKNVSVSSQKPRGKAKSAPIKSNNSKAMKTPSKNTKSRSEAQKKNNSTSGKSRKVQCATNNKNKAKCELKKAESTPISKNQKKCVIVKKKVDAIVKKKVDGIIKKKVDGIVKKKVDVKVLKDKVKLMKNKLKSMTDLIKDKAIVDIKEKLKVKNIKRKTEQVVEQATSKRKSTRISSTPAQKKQKIEKPNKVDKEDIFSPRPSRRNVPEKATPKTKPKVVKPTPKNPKVGKSPKTKHADKTSSQKIPRSKKSPPKQKSKPTESKLPKLHALKRSLRSQANEAPISKRRRQG